MELLPPEKRPVSGTQGAEYRKRQMAKQLPEHDQDPSHCHELSPGEVKIMQQYVRKCKDEALGVGDLKLLEELVGGVTPSGAEGHVAQGGKSCPETDLKDGTRSLPEPEPQAYKATISTTGSAGAQGNSGKDYVSQMCICRLKWVQGSQLVWRILVSCQIYLYAFGVQSVNSSFLMSGPLSHCTWFGNWMTPFLEGLEMF